MSKMRRITYAQAINEALHQLMQEDERVFAIGQGVNSPWYVGSTTRGLLHKFGAGRVIDTPVSENSITGIAAGSAIIGMRPVLMYPRMDFMYYAMDQIANHAASWNYMFGGAASISLTLRGIINRGGEQAAQHSQSLQAIFTHIPGLKVVMPSTPYDAKGLLISAVKDNNPVVYIDDRWLYNIKGEVPKDIFSVPLGKGIIRRKGKDATIIAVSYLAHEAMKAAEVLGDDGMDIEVIDVRTLKPLDKDLIFSSVKKTGRAIIADAGWRSCGFAAEISALITENIFSYLKAPVVRITLPDAPAPASRALESIYYPKAKDIILAAKKLFDIK